MSIEVSIIVPVYNLEEYLSQCIDSILAQTFTNFELILVNDGSTDHSGEVCERYADLDSRVKVIHKENGGVASSRNTGLEVAQGNYIGFVDNDDYINEWMFETLYNQAMNNSSDIVICDYVEVDENQCNKSQKNRPDYTIQHYDNLEALDQLYTTNGVTFVVPWNKLYRRKLFDGIKYEIGNMNDDETVAHQMLFASNKITYLQGDFYYYVQRSDSQTNSSFSSQRFDAIYALKGREIFFRKLKLRDLQQKALKHYMEKFFWYYYLGEAHLTKGDQQLKLLKRTFDRSLVGLLKHREISWKQKVMCVVFRVNPSLFKRIKEMESRNKNHENNQLII